MEDQTLQRIREHLAKPEVQERIQKRVQEVRDKATVTISRAAKLLDLTENKLRDWEKRGLLQSDRSSSTPEVQKGHRQYSSTELEKLALIQELLNSGIGLGEIPNGVENVWNEVVRGRNNGHMVAEIVHSSRPLLSVPKAPIDTRIEQSDEQDFWRYFVGQALRLSLLLLSEEIPETLAGILLPLHSRQAARLAVAPSDLATLGPCLVGWLDPVRGSRAFIEETPSFEVPSDFRVHNLLLQSHEADTGDRVLENTLIILQRKAEFSPLAEAVQATIRRLLALVYQHQEEWERSFALGPRDWLQIMEGGGSAVGTREKLLSRLTDLVVELGGNNTDGAALWWFSCVLGPIDGTMPVQQQTLVVQAQSQESPYKVGVTRVGETSMSPGSDPQVNSLSLRAFQSGQIIRISETVSTTTSLVYYDVEEGACSAIAVPIMGEDGLSAGALYVASKEPRTFTEDDQRVLRIFTRMIEEQFLLLQSRRLMVGKLGDIINQPELVDSSFRGFYSESDFISTLNQLLSSLFESNLNKEEAEREISFIAIDIDNQSARGIKYGNHVARNLAYEVGRRVLGKQRLFSDPEHRKLYHLNADRFYLFLPGRQLSDARKQAEQLRIALAGSYRVNSRRQVEMGTVALTRENMLELPNVTVRLGIPSYTQEKLKALMQRYSPETCLIEVRTLIMRALDQVLYRGQSEGGNCIISWDPLIWDYRPWSPEE